MDVKRGEGDGGFVPPLLSTAGPARISGRLDLDMDPRLIEYDPAPGRAGNLREKFEARDSLVLDALKPAHHRLTHAERRGQGRLREPGALPLS